MIIAGVMIVAPRNKAKNKDKAQEEKKKTTAVKDVKHKIKKKNDPNRNKTFECSY